MKKLSLYLFVSLAGFFATSCVHEFPEETSEYAFIDVNLCEDGADTKTSLTVDPTELKSVQLFAFDQSTGNMLYYDSAAGDLAGKPVTYYKTGSGKISWCLPVGVTMDIFAVGNLMTEIAAPADIESLMDHDKMTFRFSSLADLNALEALPMTGEFMGATCTGAGEGLYIPMKKYFDKYKLNLHFEEAGTILSVKVKNANGVIRLFSNNAASSTSQIISEFDYSSAADLTADYITLIVPENRQTQLRGVSSNKKDLLEIREDPTFDGSDKCTYMSIEYINKWNEQVTDMIYFGSGLNNYDVKGGYETVMNVNMSQFEPKGEFYFNKDIKYFYQYQEERIGFTFKYLKPEELTKDYFSCIYGCRINEIVLTGEQSGYVKLSRSMLYDPNDGTFPDGKVWLSYTHTDCSDTYNNGICKKPTITITGPDKVLSYSQGIEYTAIAKFVWPDKSATYENLDLEIKEDGWADYEEFNMFRGDKLSIGYHIGIYTEYYKYAYVVAKYGTDEGSFASKKIMVYWAHEYTVQEEMIHSDREREHYQFVISCRQFCADINNEWNKTYDVGYTYIHPVSGYEVSGPYSYEVDLDESYNWINTRQYQDLLKVDTAGQCHSDGQFYGNKTGFMIEFEASRVL